MPGSETMRAMAGDGWASAGEEVGPGAGVAFGFLRALWELNHALESASRTMKRRLGVTGPERLFVRVVGLRPGITPRGIAHALRVHPSSITVLIKRLEQRRLIARAVNASDARSFHLYLTPEGQRVDAVRHGTIEAAVRDAIKASDAEEVATASRLLVSIAQRLASSMRRASEGRRRPVSAGSPTRPRCPASPGAPPRRRRTRRDPGRSR
ncbi:MAG: MarR family winged helix-turn-helix transcriptional regulator [Anaeromyxobacteraceae bacterium]